MKYIRKTTSPHPERGYFIKKLHSYPIIFQKTDIFAMFEREKIDFPKVILSDFHKETV